MKKTKKALASLAIAGMALTMVPFNAFAASTVPTRLAGTAAEQTAAAIADQIGWTGTAILASSTSYGMVDALTAGPLASYLKAPILLTGVGALNADTKAELAKLAVKTVYVTSGTAVISQAVLNELTGMGITVIPLGGVDKYETSVNIAKKMEGVTKVVIANGIQDALSIAAIASAANEPILLTQKDALPASVKKYLAETSGITTSDVIGGTGVISEAIKASLPSATRHAGNTAYDTNNQVIQDFDSYLTYDNVYLANGVSGIDALAGAPLAAQTKSAMILTDGTIPAAAAFVKSKLVDSSVITAIGGEAVVPELLRTAIVNGLSDVLQKAKDAASNKDYQTLSDLLDQVLKVDPNNQEALKLKSEYSSALAAQYIFQNVKQGRIPEIDVEVGSTLNTLLTKKGSPKSIEGVFDDTKNYWYDGVSFNVQYPCITSSKIRLITVYTKAYGLDLSELTLEDIIKILGVPDGGPVQDPTEVGDSIWYNVTDVYAIGFTTDKDKKYIAKCDLSINFNMLNR
jgi:Putative cell wall-binding domain